MLKTRWIYCLLKRRMTTSTEDWKHTQRLLIALTVRHCLTNGFRRIPKSFLSGRSPFVNMSHQLSDWFNWNIVSHRGPYLVRHYFKFTLMILFDNHDSMANLCSMLLIEHCSVSVVSLWPFLNTKPLKVWEPSPNFNYSNLKTNASKSNCIHCILHSAIKTLSEVRL